jgi:hypothetical protein
MACTAARALQDDLLALVLHAIDFKKKIFRGTEKLLMPSEDALT